jgi:hypothetical protein
MWLRRDFSIVELMDEGTKPSFHLFTVVVVMVVVL